MILQNAIDMNMGTHSYFNREKEREKKYADAIAQNSVRETQRI